MSVHRGLKAGVIDSSALGECQFLCEVHAVNVPTSVRLTDSSVTSGGGSKVSQCFAHSIMHGHALFLKDGKGHSVETKWLLF